MTKRLKSKHKVDRRLKANLWGRPKKVLLILEHILQDNMDKIKKANQLITNSVASETKLKAYYGNINERQFRNIYRKALSKKGDTTENLIALLESRLDTVIYRAKFYDSLFSKTNDKSWPYKS